MVCNTVPNSEKMGNTLQVTSYPQAVNISSSQKRYFWGGWGGGNRKMNTSWEGLFHDLQKCPKKGTLPFLL